MGAGAPAERPPPGEDGPNPFAAAPAPPCAEGPAAVEAWAADLGATALEAADAGQDVARVLWVARGLRRLGQLKDKARHSHKAVAVLREFKDVEVDLLSEERPAHGVALVAWAYFRLARALHEAATAPVPWDELAVARWGPVVEAAAALGFLPQVQAIRALTALLREDDAGARPRP